MILGNFKQCRWALHDLQNGGNADLKTISTAESHAIKSPQTARMERALRLSFYPKGTANEDALLSGFYRYFMLQDYMAHHNVSGHVLHLDSDSMLYADLEALGAAFHAQYRGLAVSPSIHKRFLSAAVMYVPSREALGLLNRFFLQVVENGTGPGLAGSSSGSGGGDGGDAAGAIGKNSAEGSLPQYEAWLRGFACCKHAAQGGLLPDPRGEGVRPWAVNDMTLLAYYRLKHHRRVSLFPVLPRGLNESVAFDRAIPAPAAALTLASTPPQTPTQSGDAKADPVAPLPPPDHPHLPSAALREYVAPPGMGLVDCWGGWGMHVGAGNSSGGGGGGGGVGGSSPNPNANPIPNPNPNTAGSHKATATDRHAVVEQVTLIHYPLHSYSNP